MKRNLYLFMSLAFVSAVAVAQPSLSNLKARLQSGTGQQPVADLELSQKMSFLGTLRMSGTNALSEAQSLDWLRGQLQLRTGEDALQLLKTETTKEGIRYQTVQQSYKGIRVEHGRIKIISKNGVLSFMQLEFYPIPGNIATAPTLSSDAALQQAMAFVNATKYVWEGYTGTDPEYLRPTGELVYVQDIFKSVGKMCLAWKFTITAEEPVSKAYVYVNATTGDVVFTDQIIKHVNATGTADTRYSGTQSMVADNTGSSFRLRAQKNGDSIVTLNYKQASYGTAGTSAAVDFTDNDNNWTSAEFNNATYDNAALDVHWGIQKVSDYWNLVRGRASWDNNHAAMRSYVHVRYQSTTANWDNAFWNGSAMYYGDGTYLTGGTSNYAFLPLTCLDVTAHELGHAVCQTTAALVYQRESGGLNEGFSDIWGAAVEHYSGLGAPKQNFKIGEEITPRAGYLRDMQTPNNGGQPDTYFGTYWSTTTLGGCPTPGDNNDNCGVHTNSGILNKWFYLIVQGESGTTDFGDTYNVAGLGWTKAEQIAYATELALTANSDYAATRTASINAAITLFGACSNEVIQVTNAWFAVGVGATANCTPVTEFVKATSSVTEGTGVIAGCGTKTINVPVKLGTVATQPVTITFTTGGTAVNNVHYTLPSNTVTFATGESGTKNLAITLLDNTTIDGNKTLSLSYSLNANGGNGVAGANNQSHTITITDDDFAPVSLLAASVANVDTVFKENFDAAAALPTGWVIGAFSGSGSTNNWTVGANGGTGITGNAAYISNSTTTKPLAYTNTSTTDRILITKSFSTANFRNLKMRFKYKVEGEYYTTPPAVLYDYGRLMYSLNGSTFFFINDSITNSPIVLFGKGTAVTDTTISLPAAIANLSTVYFGFRWTSDYLDGTNPPLLVDDIVITGRANRATVESTSSAATSTRLISGNNYLYNGVDSQLVARIANLSQNVGCVTAGVSVAGNNQQTINTEFSTYQATQKVIQISPATPNSTATYTGTFYFTAAELSIWGASKTNLKFLKVQDGVSLRSTLNSSNAQVITPTSVTDSSATTGVIAYTGNFTGFSQFLLIDQAVILPINLTSFKVSLQGKDAVLTWETAQEINNRGFEVLRSLDGVNFSSIGFVQGRGNTTTPSNYTFTDAGIPTNVTVYYRLRQTDTDNKSSLSRILTVRLSDKASYITALWPNPATTEVHLSFNSLLNAGTITIIDQQGRRLLTQVISQPTLQATVRTSNLAAGSYLLQLSNGENTETQKLIIRNR